ncbi:hypothetical protein ACHWQZ_G014199 [Mnemiopsis leidyi]
MPPPRMTEEYCDQVLETQHPYLPNSSSISEQLYCSSYIYSQGISQPWERVVSILVLTAGILVGLVGNILVILSSLKYGTLKLDRVTIVLVRNLAIADVMLVVAYDLPLLVTHVSGRWVLGQELCAVVGYGFVVPACANLTFVTLVSLHRYMRCRWPLKAGLININHTRAMVLSQWIICFLFWPIYAAAVRVKLELNRNVLICVYTFADAERVPHFVFMCFTLVSCVVTIFTNLAMWQIVRKLEPTKRQSRISDTKIQNKQTPSVIKEDSEDILETDNTAAKQRNSVVPSLASEKRQSVMKTQVSSLISFKQSTSSLSTTAQTKALITTTVVTSLFLISWIPTLIRYFMAAWPFLLIIPPPTLDKIMVITFSLGCWLNPIIYTIINKGFRNFVKNMIRGKISSLSTTMSQS